jgi:hypothetical protein
LSVVVAVVVVVVVVICSINFLVLRCFRRERTFPFVKVLIFLQKKSFYHPEKIFFVS